MEELLHHGLAAGKHDVQAICHDNKLAFGIIRRLVDRYGQDIVIVHGDTTGENPDV